MITRLQEIYVENKPDRAKMRPDCVLACIDYGDRHVRYMEGQISRLIPIDRFSVESLFGQKEPGNAVFAQA